MSVSVPLESVSKYDVIVDSGNNLYKVQIKSTYGKDFQNAYAFLLGHGFKNKTMYTKEDVDIIACYINPENLWYIIPIEAVMLIKFRLYPDKKSKYNKYKEAWDILS